MPAGAEPPTQKLWRASTDPPSLWNFHVDQGHTHDFVLELQRAPFGVHDRADADDLWCQTTTSWSTSIPNAATCLPGATFANPSPPSGD